MTLLGNQTKNIFFKNLLSVKNICPRKIYFEIPHLFERNLLFQNVLKTLPILKPFYHLGLDFLENQKFDYTIEIML